NVALDADRHMRAGGEHRLDAGGAGEIPVRAPAVRCGCAGVCMIRRDAPDWLLWPLSQREAMLPMAERRSASKARCRLPSREIPSAVRICACSLYFPLVDGG